jgi:IS1 family transposase
MNTLSIDQQAAVIRALVEGNSLRATARLTGIARNTVSSLLRDLGSHCKNHHDRFVRDVSAKRVQMDEIWSFAKKKEARVTPEERGTGVGDCWTWVAIDSDTKLVISYRVGSRDPKTGYAFVQDLADRLASRCQLTSDGLSIYVRAVEKAFGWNGADFAQIVKIFGSDSGPESSRRYSPAVCIGTEKHWIMGKPDMDYVSTSHAERQNLTMRMQMRRFTRLTNAFSKKVEFHLYAVSLHYMHYNYCRVHMTLSKQYGVPTTPAMAAGLTDHAWSIEELLKLLHGD